MRFLRPRPAHLKSRAAYALWAKNYPPHAHNPFMALEEATMRDLLPDLTGKRVLDLACGTGRWGKIAQVMGAAQVISLDDSPAMLRSGMPPCAAAATMTALPLLNASIDAILCGLAVGHSPDLRAILAEMSRVLVPGGVALISDVHPFRAWGGAQRTFQAGSRTYAIEHYIHSYADYHAACRNAGLQIDAIREAAPNDQEPPAVLVLRLVV